MSYEIMKKEAMNLEVTPGFPFINEIEHATQPSPNLTFVRQLCTVARRFSVNVPILIGPHI